jgi:DNA polymerase-3 subunit delta'
VLALLASVVGRGTIPPSLLFAGPEGVGKRVIAVALAQAVNCLSPIEWSFSPLDAGLTPADRGEDERTALSPREAHAEREGKPQALGVGPRPIGDGCSGDRAIDGTSAPSESEAWRALGVGPQSKQSTDACGTCAACRRIARGVHSDVILVAPDDGGSIKIDDVRDAIEKTAFRPFEGRRRITIVDEADALVVNAQDALLKTLEEPPPGSVFVLVTARPDALLPTIRSRCHLLRFGRLAEEDIVAILRERHEWPEREARAAAALADGSAGAALDSRSEEAAGAREAAADLLRGLAASRGPAARLEHAKTIAAGAERDELARRLRAAASLLRDVQVIAARADARLLANADLGAGLRELAVAYGGERAMRGFSAVDRALAALDRNASPKVVADWLALEL